MVGYDRFLKVLRGFFVGFCGFLQSFCGLENPHVGICFTNPHMGLPRFPPKSS